MLKVLIRKSFPGFQLDVDFSVDREILPILGPSGSGKTMTLRCIAGLLTPDEGHIELNCRVLYDSAGGINLPAQQRGVGFVFQNYALFPHLTASENIAYGIPHMLRHEKEARVSRLLGKMRIEGLGHRFPKQLSSGQQQRVALARALSSEPQVLLLDEPFSALDPPRRERMEREVIELQRSYGGDTLFVTHDLAQGFKLGSRMAVYESGRIAQCDDKHSVIGAPVNRTVARLTGLRNLMEATVSDLDGVDVQMYVAGLVGMLKVKGRTDRRLSVGQRVLIGIRSEHVQLVDRSSENTFLCTVGQVVEGVSSDTYFLDMGFSPVDNPRLEAVLSNLNRSAVLEGQECHVRLPPEHLIIIPE